MPIYACAYNAILKKNYEVKVSTGNIALFAQNESEAISETLLFSKSDNQFPELLGWDSHKVSCVEIPIDWIVEKFAKKDLLFAIEKLE